MRALLSRVPRSSITAKLQILQRVADDLDHLGFGPSLPRSSISTCIGRTEQGLLVKTRIYELQNLRMLCGKATLLSLNKRKKTLPIKHCSCLSQEHQDLDNGRLAGRSVWRRVVVLRPRWQELALPSSPKVTRVACPSLVKPSRNWMTPKHL